MKNKGEVDNDGEREGENIQKVVEFRKEWVSYLNEFNQLIETLPNTTEYKKILDFNINRILFNNELLKIPECQKTEFEGCLVSNVCSNYIEGKIEHLEFIKKVEILNKRFFGRDFNDGLSIIYILITRKEGNEHILNFVTEKLEVLVKKFCE